MRSSVGSSSGGSTLLLSRRPSRCWQDTEEVRLPDSSAAAPRAPNPAASKGSCNGMLVQLAAAGCAACAVLPWCWRVLLRTSSALDMRLIAAARWLQGSLCLRGAWPTRVPGGVAGSAYELWQGEQLAAVCRATATVGGQQ